MTRLMEAADVNDTAEFVKTCVKLVRDQNPLSKMTVRQIAILGFLVQQNNEVTQVEICRNLNISASVVTRALDVLVLENLVFRFTHPNDRRKRMVKGYDTINNLIGAE